MTAQRAATGRAFDRVIDYVETAIVSGELKPGDRLPSERALCERLSVARSSVREALRVLASNRLIEIRPNDPRGALVLGFSPKPASAPARPGAGLELGPDTPDGDLIQFRMITDSAANLMAATLRTNADLVALERNVARMRRAMHEDDELFGQCDAEFHELIARIGRNEVLRRYGDHVRASVLRQIRQTIANEENGIALKLHSLRHHTAVLAAIRDQDGIRASRLARESLYTWYGPRVDASARRVMAALVLECGGDLNSDGSA